MMTAPLSQGLRRRLVRAVEAGSSATEAARRFEVTALAAVKLVGRMRATASTALFYLMPYSPDLNSIGQVFAKLKALLR